MRSFCSRTIWYTEGGTNHQLAVCSFKKGSYYDKDKSGKKKSKLIPRPLVLKEKYNAFSEIGSLGLMICEN